MGGGVLKFQDFIKYSPYHFHLLPCVPHVCDYIVTFFIVFAFSMQDTGY